MFTIKCLWWKKCFFFKQTMKFLHPSESARRSIETFNYRTYSYILILKKNYHHMLVTHLSDPQCSIELTC